MHCVVTLSSKLIEIMFDEIMLCCTRVKWLSQFATIRENASTVGFMVPYVYLPIAALTTPVFSLLGH